MGCAPSIEITSATTALTVVGGGDVQLELSTAPLILELRTSSVVVEAPTTSTITIEVCKQGPVGPPGPQGPAGDGDPVFVIKPDATLSYNGDEYLIRVDYADGTYKDLTYNGAGLLIQVQGENLAGETVTKTLTYTAGLLTGVTTVIS